MLPEATVREQRRADADEVECVTCHKAVLDAEATYIRDGQVMLPYCEDCGSKVDPWPPFEVEEPDDDHDLAFEILRDERDAR